jgi:hypothetical protein
MKRTTTTTATTKTSKAKTATTTTDATGRELDALPAKQEGPAGNATSYHSEKEIPLKSVFNRWEELAQAEPCKNRFFIRGARVDVDMIDTAGDKYHCWTLRGDAVVTFRQREPGDTGGLSIEGEKGPSGYIASFKLEDPAANKTLVFTDESILFNCLQNPEKLIFGAFELPRVIQIRDGNPIAAAQYAEGPDGRVYNCSLSDGVTDALDNTIVGKYAEGLGVAYLPRKSITIGGEVFRLSSPRQWEVAEFLIMADDPEGWVKLPNGSKDTVLFKGRNEELKNEVYKFSLHIEYNYGLKKYRLQKEAHEPNSPHNKNTKTRA